MVVTRTVVSDDDVDEETLLETFEGRSAEKMTIFTELLGEKVLVQYVKGEVRSADLMATNALDGKVIGLFFS